MDRSDPRCSNPPPSQTTPQQEGDSLLYLCDPSVREVLKYSFPSLLPGNRQTVLPTIPPLWSYTSSNDLLGPKDVSTSDMFHIQAEAVSHWGFATSSSQCLRTSNAPERCCSLGLGHKDVGQSPEVTHKRPVTLASNKPLLHEATEILGLSVTIA